MSAGIDWLSWPLERPIQGAPRGVRMTLVCSFTRRSDALDAANILRRVAADFEDSLRRLSAEYPVVA